MRSSFNRRSAARAALFVCFATIVLLQASCGSGKPPCFPVTGQVVAGSANKPAVGAMVYFNPVQKQEAGTFLKPSGTVDEQGRFALTTWMAHDGAPAGEYVITVTWLPIQKSAFDPGGEDRLKGAYSDPAKSKLRFTVQNAPSNDVPVIQLP